ncbi:MAG: tRNA lysidine(34) synthetase TilS [Cyanobacteria bacterium CRU_2_1]|nr:tRNA lysidine(34) synthetase TilS [Cyanobacteria bacterium RU_5_0]NJR63452.1 tRNA lysidine(34) synthetase TilS [Cyanobacteria bacterium CRU_2_1]
MTDSQNWTLLHAQLHRTLRNRSLLPKSSRSLVAVSGGQDSLCLIRLLLDLQSKWDWELAIAHCNHRWRTDSTANANYVKQLAQTWQIPYYGVTATDIPTSEAAAREWRYLALTEIAQKHGYACIVTGHTASDRAETFLYNLMRGSGADGLQALTWQRELVPGIALVRPLLEIARTETAQCCQNANLKIWEDSTNEDWRYTRNRIRHELIPYLRTHFNPQVEQALVQTADLLQAEVEYLEAAASELWQQAIWKDEFDFSSDSSPRRLNRIVLRSAPLALQRRVVRQFLQALLPTAPNFEHIEKLVALITAPNRSQTDPFPGGAIAQVEGKWIVVSSGHRD